MPLRIVVSGAHSAAAEAVVAGSAALGIGALRGCSVERLYFLEIDPGDDDVLRLTSLLLADPVTEQATWGPLEAPAQKLAGVGRSAAPSMPHTQADAVEHPVEVSWRPGVTDVAARELARGLVEIGLPACQVATGTRYVLTGDLSADEVRRLARGLLCNETVQHFALGPLTPHFGESEPATNAVESVPLRLLGADALVALSKERLLSLDLAEMRAIQRFFSEAQRDPTDVELETLAQTWSEHCVHKTFRAFIDFTHLNADGSERERSSIDGLLNTFIRAATQATNPPWLRSAFVDNAGIVAFDDHFDLAFKVETHNHPSALEPFGGANTGVGGVVRDIIGVSARPIATTDVLCFGPQDLAHDQLPPGVLHPQRIAEGVVAGVADYGNKLGLPTVNGAVIFDEGYLGNPLVFCGCVGLLPHGSHPTAPQVGDLIVAAGGRTGRDGLHGATFSSAELTHETSESAGSAVQIGDPITEKGLIELIEAARDARLYTAITDCGAGGFSSAVGEMASELGAEVELSAAPLKYPGLKPWEIWLSEAQERMVLAVPPANLPALQQLADLWDVELAVLGRFTGDGNLRVLANGATAAHLPMNFLHGGLPRRRMPATWQEPAPLPTAHTAPGNLEQVLIDLLGIPSLASKEAIVRRYDHEVRGGTLVRPFNGPQMDGPGDAAVLKPLGTWEHPMAFALAAGIQPDIGRSDPYAMALAAVDEAVRNLVAVGADPDRIALLDNFCWGNPTLPDRLGALVRCCQGCYDAALAYNAPFISGKDSLYNEFNGKPIPGTLLISALSLVPDLEHTVTAHLKAPGNRLYLLGETHATLAGSVYLKTIGAVGGEAPGLPVDAPARYRALHAAMRRGLVRSAHDLSEGGLAVALAEMALGGRLGATVELGGVGLGGGGALPADVRLFSETLGRLLIEVAPADVADFEVVLAGQPLVALGDVNDRGRLQVTLAGEEIIDVPVETLVAAWKRLPLPAPELVFPFGLPPGAEPATPTAEAAPGRDLSIDLEGDS